ncbi:MAG: RDD family protein [Terracidiphilus sp.]
MSTLASSPTPVPSWKQEVNRRLAEHKNRKGMAVLEQDDPDDGHVSANSRAAAAAARVAARYAKAPSFSEMQAAEARGALRAAEAATRAALEAQAAAQAVLDHIQNNAGQDAEVEYDSHFVGTEMRERELQNSAVTPRTEAAGVGDLEIRWEPDMPARLARQETRPARTHSSNAPFDTPAFYDSGPIYETVEAAQPIAANLIEFPREIVATRRMRPRITEASLESSEPQQLSIFEVDPNTVSTEPMAAATTTAAEPMWIGTSWQQIELDEQPQPLPDYYALQPDSPRLYQAPFGRRMMAAMVDTALILSLVWGMAYLVASRFDHLPSIRVSEVCGVILTLGFATLYEWFFLTFAKVTPGMRYAQLSLCTFDEQVPTSAQVKERMKAMLISVLPVGLGMVWSIFDEDQMSWHDRLSKTYLRLS